MNRFGFLLCWILGSCSLSKAQLYISDQAVIDLQTDALLYVKNGDIENNGSLYLNGEIELIGNLINADLVESPPGATSKFSLSGDWTNDGQFNAGVGSVYLNGRIQNIQGINPSSFYNLNLSGVPIDQKNLLSNIEVGNQLDLAGAVLNINTRELVLKNSLLQVLQSGGFLQTDFGGKVNIQSTAASITPFILPFGSNPAQPIRRKFALISPPAGNYSAAFIRSSPNLHGMDPNLIQDSICRLFPDHFWYFNSGQTVEIGVEKDISESIFDRLSAWTGNQWTQIPVGSKLSGLPGIWISTATVSGFDSHFTLNSQAPFVQLEPDFQIYRRQTRTIQSNSFVPKNGSLIWDPVIQLSCGTCPYPVFDAGYSELLTLRAENDICEDSDELYVEVLVREEVFTQNAFTPNGDSRNDLFMPVLVENEELMLLEIYNRWGEKLFEGNVGWDGTYLSQPVAPGVYMYKFTVRRKFGESHWKHIHRQGTVQILK